MGGAPVDADLRNRVISEVAADWQFWVREDGATLEHLSGACEEISGFSREEFLAGAVRLRDYVHPDDYPRLRGLYADAVAGKSGHDIEFRIRRKDGALRWGSLSFVPVRDDGGRFLGFRGSIRDITDRKVAEEALRREREMLDNVVSSIGVGLVLIERDLGIAWYNATQAAVFGSVERNRGKCCFEVFGRQAEPCPGCPVVRAFATGQVERAEKVGVAVPGGGTKDLVLIASPVIGSNGAVERCLEIVLDVTERRARKAERERLREQLLQAQKLEAVGTLAAGAAHEFNNLLVGILGVASLLLARAEPGTSQFRHLCMIENSANRAAELTRQLLRFARKGQMHVRAVALNDVVRETLSLVRTTFDRAIAVEEDLAPALPPVFADPSQLGQVLLNMCINARDAMPQGGTLRVATAAVEAGPAEKGPAGLESGRYLLLSVRDSGSGIPQATLSRIFEPFFTTKEPGKGTGMGLAVAYGIVKEHGGAIEVDSTPGCGTEFRVFLPAAPAD